MTTVEGRGLRVVLHLVYDFLYLIIYSCNQPGFIFFEVSCYLINALFCSTIVISFF
jgi:hypothetical protein